MFFHAIVPWKKNPQKFWWSRVQLAQARSPVPEDGTKRDIGHQWSLFLWKIGVPSAGRIQESGRGQKGLLEFVDVLLSFVAKDLPPWEKESDVQECRREPVLFSFSLEVEYVWI